MKTKYIFLSALVLSVVFFSFQKGPDKNVNRTNHQSEAVATGNSAVQVVQQIASNSMTVYYRVYVHLAPNAQVCGQYAVKVTDKNGKAIAPPQVYVPGQVLYTFTESPRSPLGVRIARLVTSALPDIAVCRNQIYTSPQVMLIQFANGMDYQFDLYPKYNPPQIPH
jgi:hypothetical protein